MRSGGLGPARGLAAPCAPRSRYPTLRPAGSPPPKASLLRLRRRSARSDADPGRLRKRDRLWNGAAAGSVAAPARSPLSNRSACGRRAPETTGATPGTAGAPIPGKAGDEPNWQSVAIESGEPTGSVSTPDVGVRDYAPAGCSATDPPGSASTSASHRAVSCRGWPAKSPGRPSGAVCGDSGASAACLPARRPRRTGNQLERSGHGVRVASRAPAR
jgi:hypothetical protein